VLSESGEKSALLVLQRATHRTLHALAVRTADLKLSSSEMNVLANLADGRARSVRQLSLDTGTLPTTLTGVLDRLERRNYLTRELDTSDRRSFRVALTEPGREVAIQVLRAVIELERNLLAGLSDQQLAGYHAVITALLETR
jgi:DNA-binding MarR family transcriptional regulator